MDCALSTVTFRTECIKPVQKKMRTYLLDRKIKNASNARAFLLLQIVSGSDFLKHQCGVSTTKTKAVGHHARQLHIVLAFKGDGHAFRFRIEGLNVG